MIGNIESHIPQEHNYNNVPDPFKIIIRHQNPLWLFLQDFLLYILTGPIYVFGRAVGDYSVVQFAEDALDAGGTHRFQERQPPQLKKMILLLLRSQ